MLFPTGSLPSSEEEVVELGASGERPKLERWKDSSDHGNQGGEGRAKRTQAFGKQRQDPRQRGAWLSQGLRDHTLVSRIGTSPNFTPGRERLQLFSDEF